MHTRTSSKTLRHIACAAFLVKLSLALGILFTLHPSLFSQSVPQPEIPSAATDDYVAVERVRGDTIASGTTAIPTTAEVTAAAATAASGTTATNDDVVQMSPFVVDGKGDQGYQAINTTSGSRINTPLRDTAASISPFTEEFLSDVGATSIEEVLSYAGNMEADSEDSTNGFNNPQSLEAGNSDNAFRIRGIAAGVSVNYVNTGIPQDMYNIGTAEISSGANSILFGMGPQGGLLTLTTKRANVQRNTLNVKNTIGTWINPGKAWNYERFSFDYNVVLLPKKWAFRLLGVYQDGGPQSWRYWVGYHQKRINPVVSIKPWKDTNISIEYEKGRVWQATTRALSSSDGYGNWDASGRPIMTGFGSAYAVPGTAVINGAGNNPSFVFVANNDTLYDFRQAYQSTGVGGLTQNLTSYYYSNTGPGALRQQDFERWSANIEQHLGRFNFQLSFNHNKNIAIAHSPVNTGAPALRADPNKYISTYNYGGPSAVVDNPYAGRLYMQDAWKQAFANQTNNNYRLTTDTTVNLGKWGRHRLVGLLEHSNQERYQNVKSEVLVDQNQVAITNITSPWDAANQVLRRNYVTEGDFRTYYTGDWGTPISDVTVGSRTFHSAYVTQNRRGSHVKVTDDRIMLADQTYWFSDKFITTLGLSFDNYMSTWEGSSRVTDPNDPRILDKSKVMNEYGFNGTWNPQHPNAWTYSLGAMWHVTGRFSAFANYSNNRGSPYLDGRTVLPNGSIPSLSRGENTEYGVLFDALGDGKWTLRLTSYITKQLGDAPITPDSYNTPSSSTLGSQNLTNIYNALYYLNPIGGTPAAGPMTAEQYATLPQYNAGTVNVRAAGYELELTANPNKHVNLRLTASYTSRNRVDVFPELFAYYNANIPLWMAMADPAKNGGQSYTMTGVTLNGRPMTLLDYIRYQLYDPAQIPAATNDGSSAISSLRTGINNQLFQQSGPLGLRPFKFNFTGKYKFTDGILKGFAAGGSVRFASYNYMPNPDDQGLKQALTMPPDGTQDLAIDPKLYYNERTMLKGNSLLFYDAMCSYKCKIFGGRSTLTLQLNVNNVFSKNVVTVGRVSSATGTWTRVYINTPRTIRFTVGLDF